jgi:transcriptional antiterminator RfaH
MLKESQNPPVIWPEDAGIENFQGTWWVAHTKSRNEKALAWQLMKDGVNYFLPMYTKTSKSRGRTIRSRLPLFSGYVFFCGRERDRLAALKTNRIANIIDVSNQAKLVSDLKPIEKVILNGFDITPHKYLKKGARCRITGGPLADIEGLVVSSGRKAKLVLQVEMLGQSTSIETTIDMVEPVD